MTVGSPAAVSIDASYAVKGRCLQRNRIFVASERQKGTVPVPMICDMSAYCVKVTETGHNNGAQEKHVAALGESESVGANRILPTLARTLGWLLASDADTEHEHPTAEHAPILVGSFFSFPFSFLSNPFLLSIYV